MTEDEIEVKVILTLSFKAYDLSGFYSVFVKNILFNKDTIEGIKSHEIQSLSFDNYTFKEIYATWSLKPNNKHIIKFYLDFLNTNNIYNTLNKKEEYLQAIKKFKESDWNLIETHSSLQEK